MSRQLIWAAGAAAVLFLGAGDGAAQQKGPKGASKGGAAKPAGGFGLWDGRRPGAMPAKPGAPVAKPGTVLIETKPGPKFGVEKLPAKPAAGVAGGGVTGPAKPGQVGLQVPSGKAAPPRR